MFLQARSLHSIVRSRCRVATVNSFLHSRRPINAIAQLPLRRYVSTQPPSINEATSSKASEIAVKSYSDDGLTRWPELTSPNGVLRTMDWIGTLSFASSACILAGSYGMDLMGCIIVSTITSVGGGTIRDVLIGNTPVFWMDEVEYLGMCVITAALTFVGWKTLRDEKIIDENGPLFWWTDTIGIGAFCVIGAMNGVRKGLPAVICIVCGVITTTFGGVCRDVLVKRDVRILHSHAELYATCAMFGASAFMGARALGASPLVRIGLGASTAMLMRYYATQNNTKLPLADWFEKKS
jgi:uncharacterized membrane protein YeiH